MEHNHTSPFDMSSSAVFRKVFLTYYSTLCVFAERFIGKVDQVEDIVQGVFLNILQKEIAFLNESHLKGYLYRSIHHACLDMIKTSRHSLERDTGFYEDQEKSEENFYLTQVTRSELLIEMQNAIAALPMQSARIIELSYLEGKSNQEIADNLGLAVQTVKNQKRIALDLLRSKLSGDAYLLLLLYSITPHLKFPFH
jgi:RNA polymerase sigma factor, sigma-70 family